MDSTERKMTEAVQPLVHQMFRDMGFWAPEIFNERLAAFIGEVVHVCARTASEGEGDSPDDSPEETETPEAQRRRAREAVLLKVFDQADIVLNPDGYLVLSNTDTDPEGTGTVCIDLTPKEFEACKGVCWK